MTHPANKTEVFPYGTMIVICIAAFVAGLLMFAGDSERVADSGQWLMILSGGGVVITALFWIIDSAQARKAAPRQR